ncbi:MAG: murein biosynthesis integral membrane protein MurJ [Actinomycetota bacterium]|nr:murein biosynthesis integral membrane protein MurJ [Actinomycetota bacterium]
MSDGSGVAVGATSGRAGGPRPFGGSIAGATTGMAVGTAVSRVTGVARLMAVTVALGGASFADAYNLANTTPNIIHDIVLGGVLAATFVPVFVDRLTTRDPDEAWRAISAVATATVVLLVVATAAFFVLTPEIVRLYTVANKSPDVRAQQRVATDLLRWFVPQLAGYGLLSLFTALLNARERFAAPMFVPIVNNVLTIGVLLWFHAIVPHPTLASVAQHHGALVLLGIGTTAGVLLQAACLAPSLRAAGLHVRFHWEPGNEALRTVVRLASWTFALVVANQLVLVLVLALADGIKTPGAVSAYTYAYTFFQLPFGVVAISVMSAVTPGLSSRWAVGDLVGFRRRFASGLRGMLAVIVPATVAMIVLSHPLVDLLLAHGAETPAAASLTGATLALFAFGLPGYSLFFYVVRALQSMQDTRTAFFLYLVENVVAVATALALVGPLGVRGLALSLTIGYSVATAAALEVMHRRLDGLGGRTVSRPLRRVAVATVVMGVVMVLTSGVSGGRSDTALVLRILLTVVAGGAVYLGTAAVLGAHESRQGPSGGGPGRAPAPPADAPAADRPPPGAARTFAVRPPGSAAHPSGRDASAGGAGGAPGAGAPGADRAPPAGRPTSGVRWSGQRPQARRPSGDPFRDRLDEPGAGAGRHLRPVGDRPSEEGPDEPGAGGHR